MSDRLIALTSLRRPGLLIRAARHGMTEYRRDKTLARLLTNGAALSPDDAVRQLLEIEAVINDARKTSAATYSVTAHVEVLIAIMSEARMLMRPAPVIDPV